MLPAGTVRGHKKVNADAGCVTDLETSHGDKCGTDELREGTGMSESDSCCDRERNCGYQNQNLKALSQYGPDQ